MFDSVIIYKCLAGTYNIIYTLRVYLYIIIYPRNRNTVYII